MPAGARRRTPRNTLSAELIVGAALELMESKGVEDFSIRALAAELGVGPMALYTYFRSKDELFDAVRNQLLGTAPPPPADASWQDQARAIVRSLRALMLQHPSLCRLLTSRPLSGHETAAMVESLLAVLRRAGFDKENAARGHTALFSYVVGATTWELQMAAEKQDPERARRLRATIEGLSSYAYPTVVELAPELSRTTGGDAQFDFGLDLLVGGLEGRLRTASS